MTPLKVVWNSDVEKWVAREDVMGGKVIKVSSSKKTAKNNAMGAAQSRADKEGVTQVVDLHTKDGAYQKSVKVSPSYE